MCNGGFFWPSVQRMVMNRNEENWLEATTIQLGDQREKKI